MKRGRCSTQPISKTNNCSDRLPQVTGNGEQEVRQAAKQAEIDAGNPRPVAPPSLYERLLTTIDTNVSSEIQDLISAIGLEPILAAQDQYEIDLADYQIALAAYNDLADKEGVTAPVAPTAPATMMVKLNDSIAQLG